MSTVNREVTANPDDAVETQDGTTGFSAGGTRISVISHSSGASAQTGGFRFLNVTIDQGDTINTATYSGYVDSAGNDDPNCDVYGEAADNCVTYSAGAKIVPRAKTTASVAWSAVAIGAGFQSPADITTVIQEIINRGGWSSGNALALIIWGRTDIDDRIVKIRAHDFGGTDFPKLDIDYTAAAATDQDITWQGSSMHLPAKEPLEVIAY